MNYNPVLYLSLMSKITIGSTFGRLSVTGVATAAFRRNGRMVFRWHCKCLCGKTTIVRQENLQSGSTQSCGCLCRDRSRESALRHGQFSEGKYGMEITCYTSAKQRCYNPKDPAYSRYGGRGIRMCKEWKDSFESFLKDMGPRPSMAHCLDRYPDNNGNYEPGNCRWATRFQQSRNTRKSKLISFNGITQCLTDWAKQIGIDKSSLRVRLLRGWPIDKALTTPRKK